MNKVPNIIQLVESNVKEKISKDKQIDKRLKDRQTDKQHIKSGSFTHWLLVQGHVSTIVQTRILNGL